MSTQRIIIASGPVIVEDGAVLLNLSGKDPFWKFCGGKTHGLDEGLVECAIRRAREEMGIGLDVIDDMPYIIHATKQSPEGKFDVILVHFLARRIGEINPGVDVGNWAWYHLDKLPEDLAPNIIPVLKHFNFL